MEGDSTSDSMGGWLVECSYQRKLSYIERSNVGVSNRRIHLALIVGSPSLSLAP